MGYNLLMPLTPKQAAFCREYLIDLNATAAAKRAGYSQATAHVQGPRLLENVKVAAQIAELQKAAAQRNEVTLDEVVSMLRKSYDEAKVSRSLPFATDGLSASLPMVQRVHLPLWVPDRGRYCSTNDLTPFAVTRSAKPGSSESLY